jgi:general secretion pathway protein B
MSYILDALRKSDQARQRAVAPTLLTAQATVPAPTRSAFPLNSWLVAALVGIGILIGWLRPWQTEPAAPMPEPDSTKTIIATPAISRPQPDLPPETREAAPERQPAPVSTSPATLTPARESAVKESSPSPQQRPEPRAAAPKETTTPEPAKPVTVTPAEAEREKIVMPLSELPPSIRQEIPNITISFHVYSSNPAERRIMINNELLRQGESIPPGLGVDQITPDGVVISYKGYRFKRGVR